MTSESVAAGLPTSLPTRLRRALELCALLLSAWLAALCSGCGPKVDNSQVKLPQPVESTTLGPGDLFTLEVVGEKDLPKEFQIASDGTVDFPYVHRMEVQGLEPQELARAVRERLMELRILTDPSVIVSVKEYNSKRVTVLGEVKKPGSFPLRPGMTLVQAISDAGGLSAIANGDRVNLTRKEKGSATTVVLSFDSITSGKSPDLPLQAGDQIFVNERVF
ncbi:MAG TPA: polysaccharide biosynthesis/export family protein [Polyangiaceae bacterium]|nr:polysaccharide biosynthesis/export family protein [Polyangiaceae bacterium]